MSEAAPLLEVRDLTVCFDGPDGPVRAVDGISFDVRVGRTLGLVGQSGCGKTTTGRAVLRLVRATGGTCLLHEQDVFALRGGELLAFRRRAQMVFQDPFSSLNPRLTVRQILAEPLCIHHRATRREMPERVAELLRDVGLEPGMARRYPHEFSGGQRQRIGIARALAVEPELLVLDEPVSSLDVTVRAQIVALLEALQARHGLSYLFIAHDLGVVRRLSDTVAVMHQGRIVEIGPAAEVYEQPQHPYTRELLAAVPVADPTRRRGRA
ncbi:MAG: ABC transporter ATP-binding protein [Armatimonadetes bacterium]|nr:ABC transporter ATP-binding protein [Armatimonadota bacterium]